MTKKADEKLQIRKKGEQSRDHITAANCYTNGLPETQRFTSVALTAYTIMRQHDRGARRRARSFTLAQNFYTLIRKV